MATNPPNIGEWINANPGKTVYDYAKLYPPDPGTALGSSSTSGGATNYAPSSSSGSVLNTGQTFHISAPNTALSGLAAAAPAPASSTPPPSLISGGGGSMGAGAASSVAPVLDPKPASASASGSMSMMGGGGGGDTPAVSSPAMGGLNLRDGLGNRLYPQSDSPLAALRKIY